MLSTAAALVSFIYTVLFKGSVVLKAFGSASMQPCENFSQVLILSLYKFSVTVITDLSTVLSFLDTTNH